MVRPCVWPSTFGTVSAPRMTRLSRLNGWPALSPADASPAPLQASAHGSGPMWIATPSTLQRKGLAPSTPCRSPGALQKPAQKQAQPEQMSSVRKLTYRATTCGPCPCAPVDTVVWRRFDQHLPGPRGAGRSERTTTQEIRFRNRGNHSLSVCLHVIASSLE
jgi:hypothetical protein